MIPLSVPNFEGNEERYVIDAVSQGWVSTGGAYVDRLEGMIAEYAGSPGAVACQSGTAALHLSLIECGVGPDDMVIVPTLTFIAAVNPVAYVHASPIFMDCDESLCMDPGKVKAFCETECELADDVLVYKATGQAVKALIVVHVFGNLADMEALMEIASMYRLRVIEDATEAIGSYYEHGRYRGKMAGTIGDFGAYSFNGNKIITTGGGGAIVSNDIDALKHLKYLSTQAKDDPHFYIHGEVGYNYRMTNVQAALGAAQMEELEEFILRKNRNYRLYCELTEGLGGCHMLGFREGCRTNKWFYSLVLEREESTEGLRGLIHELEARGIQTRPIWGLIHEQEPYKECIAYKIEKAEEYSRRIINLPCSTSITEEEIREVAKQIINVIEIGDS